jgi:hypothetical protein
MPTLFPPPPVYDLPLSKGGDLYVDFVYKPVVVDDDGEPVLVDGEYQFEEADFPSGSSVKLTIDSDPEVSATAVIDGSHAVVQSDYLSVDAVKGGKFWRLVITYADGLDEVLANGKTIRKDGAA